LWPKPIYPKWPPYEQGRRPAVASDLNQLIYDGAPPFLCNFVVRYEIEVRANAPEQPVTIARGRLLDPDSVVSFDILAMKEIAGDLYLPTTKAGRSGSKTASSLLRPFAGARRSRRRRH
jgi:hypothetical protein